MNNIDTLIAQLCPDGVEFRELGEVAEIGTGNNNRVDSTDDGLFPFYVRSKEVYKIKTFAFDEEAIIIPGEGGIGEIFHYINGKYGLHQRAYRIHLQINEISTKFIYYYMMSNFKKFIIQKAVNATVSSIRKPMIEKFPIPIPPLPIQQGIVNILDKFTQLQAELQAELQARRTQYEYYRNELLNFEGKEVEWKTLKEVSKILRGTAITEKETISGEFPVVANSPNPIYFHGKSNRSGETIVIARSGAYSGLVSYWNIPFFLTDAFSIHPDNTLFKTKFVYFFLKKEQEKIHQMKKGSGVPHVRAMDFESYSVPIPPLAEQNRIVAILDKFDKLVNDISEGLPAEIEARRKQYEYYRGKLLTFKGYE
jgi:type I restriction enzyme S subunit